MVNIEMKELVILHDFLQIFVPLLHMMMFLDTTVIIDCSTTFRMANARNGKKEENERNSYVWLS